MERVTVEPSGVGDSGRGYARALRASRDMTEWGELVSRIKLDTRAIGFLCGRLNEGKALSASFVRHSQRTRQESHGVDPAPGLLINVFVRLLPPDLRIAGVWDADDEAPCEENFKWAVGYAYACAGYEINLCCLKDVIGTKRRRELMGGPQYGPTTTR